MESKNFDNHYEFKVKLFEKLERVIKKDIDNTGIDKCFNLIICDFLSFTNTLVYFKDLNSRQALYEKSEEGEDYSEELEDLKFSLLQKFADLCLDIEYIRQSFLGDYKEKLEDELWQYLDLKEDDFI